VNINCFGNGYYSIYWSYYSGCSSSLAYSSNNYVGACYYFYSNYNYYYYSVTCPTTTVTNPTKVPTNSPNKTPTKSPTYYYYYYGTAYPYINGYSGDSCAIFENSVSGNEELTCQNLSPLTQYSTTSYYYVVQCESSMIPHGLCIFIRTIIVVIIIIVLPPNPFMVQILVHVLVLLSVAKFIPFK
jgi:hypothetical protein